MKWMEGGGGCIDMDEIKRIGTKANWRD